VPRRSGCRPPPHLAVPALVHQQRRVVSHRRHSPTFAVFASLSRDALANDSAKLPLGADDQPQRGLPAPRTLTCLPARPNFRR
jgi:hypothetical protein